MATNKNFEVKNGLTIAGTERITSAGAFTGSLASATTATTQSAADSSTKIATTAYTDAAITAVIGGAPGTLDTLNELAAAINDDASYASTLTTALATKAPLASPAFNSGTTNVVASFTSTDGTGAIQLADNAGNVELSAVGNDFHIQNAGATAKMVVLNSGNVGIGTSSPSKTLHVNGELQIENNLTLNENTPAMVIPNGDFRLFTGGSERMRIDSSGNVGIGTISPATGLHVVTGGGTTPFRVQGGANSGVNIMEVGYAGGGAGANFIIDDNGRCGIGTSSPSAPLDIAATSAGIELQTTDNTSYGYLNFGDPQDNNIGQILYDHASNYMRFQVNNTEKMRIDSSGNVGIGTTQAKHPLHVYLTNGELAHFGSNQTNSVGTYSGIGLGQCLANNTTYQKIAIVAEGRDSGSYISNLHFLVDTAVDGNSAVLSDSKMMISGANGYVGIGTTSPGAKLEISGKDDAGASDLLALQFDNSPADTGMTFTDIFSGVKSRFTLDSSNTNDLRISSATQMHFYGGTSNGTGNGHLLINSSGHVGIVAGKRFYLDNASIASGDTYIDEYSSNEVGITTGGSRKLAVSGGNLYVSGSVNANHNFSDERLKENIVVIPNALEKVSSLRGITFTRKDDGSVGTGLIAQELEAVLPEAVYEAKMVEELENPDAEAWKSINYGNTVGLLVEAMKELTTKLEAAEARITTLEG